ncbi:MAG: hypothetical protein ABIH92_05565 [Nanoarchaeota archaeon]
MPIQFALPFGDEKNVKDLVFTILSKEYPLRVIDLMKLIRKRYGRSVTFQAVRKAVLELVGQGILLKQEVGYAINKNWVREAKEFLDGLNSELNKERIGPKKVDSIGGKVSVFTFNSLNEMMKFWQDIIDDWFDNFEKGDPNVNCYQASHLWEGLLHLDREKRTWEQMKKKKIVSYVMSIGNTPLDKSIRKFYESLGAKIRIDPSRSSFDKSYYVGTYGDLVVQSQYPEEIVLELEKFFKKNKSIKEFNLKELSDIVNKKIKLKLTVIKDSGMAKQINKSIMSEF